MAFICNNFATLELIAAPEATAGPKRPTEPPKPTVNGAVTRGKYIFFTPIIPFFLDKAKSIEEMACANFSLCTNFT